MVAASIRIEGWTVAAVPTSDGGVSRNVQDEGRSWLGKGMLPTCFLLEGGAPTLAAPASSDDYVECLVKRAETDVWGLDPLWAGDISLILQKHGRKPLRDHCC